MAISITHSYTVVGADDPAKEVSANRWNAPLSTSMATARLLGRTTASAGAFEEISVGTGLTFGSLSLAFDTTYGDGRYGRLGAANTFIGTQKISSGASDGSIEIVGVGDPAIPAYVRFHKGDGTQLGTIGMVDVGNQILGFTGYNGGSWAIEGASLYARSSGAGYAILNAGDPTNSGYVAWFNADGSRLGYLGFADSTAKVINMVGDVGTSWALYGGLTADALSVSGSAVWHSGNLDKPVKCITKAGAATTSDIPAGEARVVKDTSGGTVKLQYNDGGTLKSVTLT